MIIDVSKSPFAKATVEANTVDKEPDAQMLQTSEPNWRHQKRDKNQNWKNVYRSKCSNDEIFASFVQ